MQSDLSVIMPLGLPDGWSHRTLQEVAAHITKGATPTTFGFAWGVAGDVGGIPFMRSECVQNGEFVPKAIERIPEKAHALMARSAVVGGDLLITITGNIGRVCRYPADAPDANINQHIARIRLVRPDIADSRYTFWALHNPRQQIRLNKDLTGLAYPQISLVQVQAIPLLTPPLPEQRRIAEILDTLDEAIRKTEQVIAKLQQMKQGLLHDLLTRGIDENGDLRDPERHPEQFKDSALGRIPMGWTNCTLGELAVCITSGSRGWAALYAETGSLFVRSQNVRMGCLDLSDRQHVAVPNGSEGQRTRLYANDILVTITGNSVGNVTQVPDDWNEVAFVSQHVGLVRLVQPELAPFVSLYLVEGSPGNLQLLDAQSGQSKPGLNLDNLRSLRVALPPDAEGAEIVSRLSCMGGRLEREAKSMRQLCALKIGLMDDLLTGRVRTHSPEASP